MPLILVAVAALVFGFLAGVVAAMFCLFDGEDYELDNQDVLR